MLIFVSKIQSFIIGSLGFYLTGGILFNYFSGLLFNYIIQNYGNFNQNRPEFLFRLIFSLANSLFSPDHSLTECV